MTPDDANRSDGVLRYAELLLRKGMQDEAAELLQDLLRRDPGCARGHYLLAVLRAAQGAPEPAAEHFKSALACRPDDVKALNGLGVVLQRLGKPEEAARCYREANRIDPCYQDALINLALLFKDHGRLCAAQRLLEEGIRLQPDALRLRYNLANNLHFQGRSLEAVDAYRETLRLDPNHLGALQNLLFALHYSTRFGDRDIFAAHLEAATRPTLRTPARTARGAASFPAGRRIRVGYLSPDFRGHAVASFIEPILAHHDKSRFQVYCYANLERPDLTTERLKSRVEFWRDLFGVSDEDAAQVIAEDGIDILVDLAGHTAGNRLPLFARRPAPLQVTWIGYPDTTGLPEIDYRITDRFADPPGTTERFHSERLIRLEPCFCCYQPPDPAPPVTAPPSLSAGRITFGSFNNLSKVTPEVTAVWARVLQGVEGSHMLIKCPPLSDAEVCARILGEFRDQGIPAERIELHAGNPGPFEHLAEYGRIDIALDTYPYNGTTTSCEALWMGVPVVSLAGTRHASRTGMSILSNCGLAQLVAHSADQYISIACALARDAGKLEEMRSGMRERMAGSPLMDGAGVTRELEAAYRGMLAEMSGPLIAPKRAMRG